MADDIAAQFFNYFKLIFADTPELKRQAYRLRYHIYCLETGFENPEDHPDGVETDEYDDQSMHCLIKHVRTGAYAATIRLIMPNLNNLARAFPIEEHTHIEHKDLLKSVPRQKIAEISRFCVSKDFKRRPGEAETLAGIPLLGDQSQFDREERRTFPLITLGLIAGAVHMSLSSGITHWYTISDAAIIRFFHGLGIIFTPLGPAVDYHGLRRPYLLEAQHMLDGLKEKRPDAWDLVTNYGRFSLPGEPALLAEGQSDGKANVPPTLTPLH